MKVQKALKETGKARRDKWGEKEYIYKKGMYFIDNTGEPFNREDITADVWQPYHEVKEIRPEKAGELWQLWKDVYYHTVSNSHGKISLVAYAGTIDTKGVGHNKNGWTREFPKVEDPSVKRIRIKDVTWHKGIGNGVSVVFPVADNSGEGSAEVGKDLLTYGPMTMILEMQKETK